MRELSSAHDALTGRKVVNLLGRIWVRITGRPPSASTCICMLQKDTWNWPEWLGSQTSGECAECHQPIYFERQNARFRKVCSNCAGWPSPSDQRTS